MTFDLTEARRLHDRADHDPSSCRTCPDTWPCATAIALGATGRSEWQNDVDPATLRRIHIPTAGWYHIATGAELIGPADATIEVSFGPDTVDPNCSYSSTEGQCILNTGHRPGHVTGTTDTPRCAANRSGLTCVMQINHTGNCIDRDGIQWNACPISRSSMGEIWPCTRYANHPDSHHDQNGVTW